MYSYTNAYLKQEGERALDLTHLRYFQAAARTQNFTKAAEEAHISQPAFSASLSKLEKELGVRLFDRIGRRIQLNECGKLYIKYVDQALACLDEGDRKLSEAGREKKRRFSLGTVSVPLVQELLSDFRVAYPDVAVRRYELLSQDVDSELADSDSGSDIILTAALGEMAEGPGCRVIKREPLFVALYRGHPLAERPAVTEADLAGYPYVSFEREQGVAVDFSEEYRMLSLKKPARQIRVNNRSTMLRVLSYTDGFTTGSGLITKSSGYRKIITLPLAEKSGIRIGWIALRGGKLSFQAERFLKLLEKNILESIQFTSEARQFRKEDAP